jgi:sterol desaturase/sphingolipid hydroxylase (fatty acid hydroxylase superfamily)
VIYSAWLFVFSLLFVVLERLWPRRRQALFRRGIASDIAYLIFNSECLGLFIGLVSIRTIAALDRGLDLLHLRQAFYMGAMGGQPAWFQFLALLVTLDFSQWLIHNALHRVPLLWRFHKVHHSVEEMDWIGNWRFHWAEIVFYRSLLYIPAAFLGFSGVVMFWYAVLNTLIGHFAHSNLRFHIGPLKYVLNSPEMHIWHHAHPDSGPIDRNFGITLSIWDWVFGTAHLPAAKDPERLGFAGIESYPGNILGQWLAPFVRREAS